jgi:hypothetical protein
MHPRSFLASVPLLLALAAADATAQASPAAQPFPGVSWGATADSVIRALGEPADRSTTRAGLDELDYAVTWDGRTGTRYVLVHPTLGTVISGYALRLRAPADCRMQAELWLREIARDYPRMEWSAGDAPEAAALCGGTPGEAGADGRDPESGTRVGIRLGRGGASLIADAISPAGYAWVGTTR